MRLRALRIGILGVLLLGVAGSAPAARKGVGLGNGKELRTRVARVDRLPRHRARPLPPPPESLVIPRPDQMSLPTEVSAAAAILMDGESGEVLFERNADEPRPPASITKILTALVILERGRLADQVVVSHAAAAVGGHRLGLRGGQRISLGDLLAAILIRSANDAAAAAAEHIGRGLSRFVALMNARAQEIGMHHSHFANPHGLDEPGHYTTARDMALLTRVALEQPAFARLVQIRGATLTIWRSTRRGLRPQARVVLSHNKLLGRLEGADGVKTGYTEAAGQCLVASATRGGQQLIAVLLNDRHRWTDAATLLEFGFGSAGGTVGIQTPDRSRHAAQIGDGRG